MIRIMSNSVYLSAFHIRRVSALSYLLIKRKASPMIYIPASYRSHAMALQFANCAAQRMRMRMRVRKGTSGRWLVTVVRP
jgi:hypothetical protein